MPKLLRRRGACLLAVGALSLLVHLPGLFAPPLDYHYHRQVNTIAIARSYHRESRPIHKPGVIWEGPEAEFGATELPVLMWLHGKLWPVLGLGEKWGRLISVAFSLAAALLLFAIIEREFGRESALYGGLLFSLVPLEVYFGRTVQPEAGALAGYLAALYFWDRHLEKDRPLWAWAAAAVGAFLAAGLKLPYAHCLIPLAALTWRRLGAKAAVDGRLWAAGLVSMGGVIAWYAYARSGVYVVPTKKTEFLAILELHRVGFFVQFLVFSRFLELVTTYGGMVFFLAGAREILWRRREPFWNAWFFGVIAHLVAMGLYAHAHEYTALPLAPVTAGLMGEGLRRLKDRAVLLPAPRRGWALAGLALLLAAVPLHGALRIKHWYRQGVEVLAEAGAAADAVSPKDALFVADCRAPSVFLYYLDRVGWATEGASGPEKREWLADKARRGARYFVCENPGPCAPGSPARAEREKKGPALWDRGGLAIFPL